jgi:hypothetical protein
VTTRPTIRARAKERIRSEPRWNWIVYFLALVLLLFTIVSLPFEQVNWIAITSQSTSQFDQPAQHTFSNGTTVPLTLFRGQIVLSGKGGLSADNSLSATVTIYFNKQYGFKPDEPNAVMLTLTGAYFEPPRYDDFGFKEWANITLTKQVSNLSNWDEWSGQTQVLYNQGGTYGGDLILDGNSTHTMNYPLPPYIHIGNDDVTVTAKTNQLLVSLTWAILLLGVLEFRVKGTGDTSKNETQEHQNPQPIL